MTSLGAPEATVLAAVAAAVATWLTTRQSALSQRRAAERARQARDLSDAKAARVEERRVDGEAYDRGVAIYEAAIGLLMEEVEKLNRDLQACRAAAAAPVRRRHDQPRPQSRTVGEAGRDA